MANRSMTPENPFPCANCGGDIPDDVLIADYPEDGEYFCSERCKSQHDELGCPHEHHSGYRHPDESDRLIACESVLRSLSSWLGQGGAWDAGQLDPKDMETRIREGIDMHIRVQAEIMASGIVASGKGRSQ